jgi:hypothetical protein
LYFHFLLFSTFKVISNIKSISKDEIEIIRYIFYNDFYNDAPYNIEKIFIKRTTEKESDPIYLSLYEDKFKREVTTISASSLLNKIVRFKYFRNANEVLFLQNIFQYSCIVELNNLYKALGVISEKKNFDLRNMNYHEYIKNFV